MSARHLSRRRPRQAAGEWGLARHHRSTSAPAQPSLSGTIPPRSGGRSGGVGSGRWTERPHVEKPEGDIPFELGIEDITVGDGAEAAAGTKVSVHYVGVAFSTGEEFDASWNRGQPFEFKLGKGKVIPSVDAGVAGMKVGGRRKLTIPSAMAYGARGAAKVIAPHEPLVFVVDLLSVDWTRASRSRQAPSLGQADRPIGGGTLMPAPEQERDRAQLEERAEGEGGAVARRVGGLAQDGLDHDAAARPISESNESRVARCFDGIMSFR